jgi:hypothetical protein
VPQLHNIYIVRPNFIFVRFYTLVAPLSCRQQSRLLKFLFIYVLFNNSVIAQIIYRRIRG